MSDGRPPIAAWRNALRDSGLDRDAKLVGFVISTYVNGSGSCFPSRATLATGASLSVRTVDRALPKLALLRFVTVTKSLGRHSNRYTLTLPTATPATPLNGDKDDIQRRHPGGPNALKANAKSKVSLTADAGASQRESAPNAARSQTRTEDFSAYDR